jgi:chromosome segregation ATPase
VQAHAAELSDEISATKAALADATKKSEELATSHEHASGELKQATDNAAKIKTELDAVLASLEEERAKIKEADEVLAQLRATKEQLDQELVAAKGAHVETTKELESARKELESACNAATAMVCGHHQSSISLLHMHVCSQ